MADRWYIEFGFQPSREPMRFGPFVSREAAVAEWRRQQEDHPKSREPYRIRGYYAGTWNPIPEEAGNG